MVISLYPLPFAYRFELQLGGTVEMSPRALVLLKPTLYTTLYQHNEYGTQKRDGASASTSNLWVIDMAHSPRNK